MTRRDERGQVTVMIVGFFVVIGLLAVVVVDASAAYLRRQSLDNLADGAALAAADGVQGEVVYTTGIDGAATIDAASADRYVRDYLRSTGAVRERPGLSWTVSRSADSVRVRLAEPLRLPLTPPGWHQRTQVTGESAVQLRVY